MKKLIIIFFLLLLAMSISPASAADFQKSKIAVLDFQMQGKEYENTDMGSIVAEWLITALVHEGRFDVVERRLLKKILTEHQLAMSGVVDDSSISELGKILGVKIIISGAVLHFQNVIEANARIIDVANGSIIAAESVKSTTASRLEELVVEMAAKIIKDFPLEGYIVSRQENKVAIDLGRLAGVKEGMQFISFKEGNVIKHPKTGEVLDVETIETGKLQITMVHDNIAYADVIEESDQEPIKYGQMVKSVSLTSQPIGKYAHETPQKQTGAYGELAEIDPLIEGVRQLKESNNPQWKINYKMLFNKLEVIYAKNPTSPEVFFYYAKACEAGGDIRKANKYIEKAVYYDPKYIEAFEFRGDMNYNYGKTTTRERTKRKLASLAQLDYESAAGINPDINYQAMMYYKIGKVHQELSGDMTLADQYMQKAISTAPGSEAARMARAQ
jgi:TolB-like protein